jgi:hypothetical protein
VKMGAASRTLLSPLGTVPGPQNAFRKSCPTPDPGDSDLATFPASFHRVEDSQRKTPPTCSWFFLATSSQGPSLFPVIFKLGHRTHFFLSTPILQTLQTGWLVQSNTESELGKNVEMY